MLPVRSIPDFPFVLYINGTGSFFGHSLIGGADGMLMMILPPGGFLALGLLMAAINQIRKRNVKN